MKADRNKLELALASTCMMPYQLATKAGKYIMASWSVKPVTLGCVTCALGMDVTDIMQKDDKTYDYIDSKFKNNTPEEYVRQTIEKRLINEHKYLMSQIKVKFTPQVGSKKSRADIVI